MLNLLQRNRRIKERPERFQASQERFDVIFTCEEKVYDNVIASFEEKDNVSEQPVHVVNMDVVNSLLSTSSTNSRRRLSDSRDE